MSKGSSISSVKSYSQALYELSKEDNCIESIEKEISNILKLLLEIEDFRNIIKDPTKSLPSNLISSLAEMEVKITAGAANNLEKKRNIYIETTMKTNKYVYI